MKSIPLPLYSAQRQKGVETNIVNAYESKSKTKNIRSYDLALIELRYIK